MRADLAVGAALGMALAGPVQAQTVDWRYAPTPGVTVATVTDVTTLTTVHGLPSIPDGTGFEQVERWFARQRVLGPVEDAWTVEVVLDSVRGRWRPMGAAWRDLPSANLDGRRSRVTLDRQFAITGIERGGPRDGEILRVLTAWVGGLDFALPDRPLPLGSGIDPGIRVPFHAVLTADSALPLRETIFGDMGLRIDSVQDRGSDSLLFLSFTGSFVPRDVETTGESEHVQASFRGGFAGRLIWSTGWDAFVSGASRFEVDADVLATTAAGLSRARIRWETTVQHRVRL